MISMKNILLGYDEFIDSSNKFSIFRANVHSRSKSIVKVCSNLSSFSLSAFCKLSTITS